MLVDVQVWKHTIGNRTTTRVALGIEVDLKVLAETRRIVVPQRLGITKRLEQRIGFENDVLDVIHSIATTRDIRNVLHHQLGSLGFTSTGLTTTHKRQIITITITTITTMMRWVNKWCSRTLHISGERT
jgi:hypothetical protein